MPSLIRKRKKELGLGELIAIALGGMVGGGIFSILGVSVGMIGNATPIAISIGGILALFAAYSYVKLALLYKDEGATYSFFKKTFPSSPFSSSAIGWLIVFGYISTLALYAFTFASYLGSVLPFKNELLINKLIAGGIIFIFAIINIVSVKGMGKIEDWLVYSKIVILLFISGLLAGKGDINHLLPIYETNTPISSIFIVAAITFVAYEGFQLVIHAYNEMDEPEKNIPKAIYGSIGIATALYIILSIAALSTIPKEVIAQDKEYALAAGAQLFLGKLGLFVVIAGALLATSSAISGTLFGASRLIAVIAKDGYLPHLLGKKRKTYIPYNAILIMAVLAFTLILSGGLQVILEFGSITFIIVSFIMSFANFKMREQTHTHITIAFIAMAGLFSSGILILYYEYSVVPLQLTYIGSIYLALIMGSFIYARKNSASAIKKQSSI